jgi:hypothetical protein
MGKIASIPDVETDKDILEYRKNEIEYWRVI